VIFCLPGFDVSCWKVMSNPQPSKNFIPLPSLSMLRVLGFVVIVHNVGECHWSSREWWFSIVLCASHDWGFICLGISTCKRHNLSWYGTPIK
jgi:hypothetical protein